MFYLAVLIFLFVLNDGASVNINLTYILEREKTQLQPSCIAEELERYAAVGWVYPMPSSGDGIPNVTTKFIPTLANDFNCKFSRNSLCSIRWSIKDWQIDENSPRTRDFLGDVRWEDLPTIFITNTTKEFENRFHIEAASKISFSVRASSSVEIFVCTGWNPYNYPCYYFNITKREIYMNKYNALPKNLSDTSQNSVLEYYKAFSNILSHDEWRNFEVILTGNGTVTLIDKNLNRTVIKHVDADALKPMYFLMRSNDSSLWKISENYFMYTKTAQISRLGPQLSTNYKDLCVSLFVSTCSNCEMTFFYLNGTSKKILKYVAPTNYEWIEIKLKEENIKYEKLNLFVETKFFDESLNDVEGYWALDEVRVCNENEVKVSFLKMKEEFAEDDLSVDLISCQLISKPNWRPVKLVYDEIKDFPEVKITTNETATHLSWNQEDPDNLISYFILYQGNDMCSLENGDSKRAKSSGFLVTKNNELIINELVPFTTYNITISSVLHENDKRLHINTLETDEPGFEELPFQVHLRPLDHAVNVYWEKPSCASRRGRLIYNLIVNNPEQNFEKRIEMLTENSSVIDGLQSYTPYTLTIVTARNARNLIKGVHAYNMSLNFTTLAGVSEPVQNLELYAIGTKTGYLRYDLPKTTHGIPEEVQVRRCKQAKQEDVFPKCKPFISKVQRCNLWHSKFCIDVNNLIENQNYVFKVSLKNRFTNAFSKEAEVSGFAIDTEPDRPENITYQIVDCQASIDYCHLNISWLHPSKPKGVITAFNIILNNSYNDDSFSEENGKIHELYKIVNKTYLPKYTYQIKYVPYSTTYQLCIYSRNTKFKSPTTCTSVRTANLGDHIDQSPKLLGKSDKALIFKLPHLDRRLESYTLTVAVQDYDTTKKVDPEKIGNQKVVDNICHHFGDTWISNVLKVKDNDTKTITITSLNENHKIKPDVKYCIIFIVTNMYRNEEHDVVYYDKLQTPPETVPTDVPSSAKGFNHLYMLFILLLLIPIGFLVYRYLRKRRVLPKQREANENVYETLPFEETQDNCVTNRTYDHLIHK